MKDVCFLRHGRLEQCDFLRLYAKKNHEYMSIQTDLLGYLILESLPTRNHANYTNTFEQFLYRPWFLFILQALASETYH